jgi:hypothetical protein
MSTTRTTILVFGHDSTLLETRRWMLEAQGYQAITLTHARELKRIDGDSDVQLLILCQSLEPLSRAQAAALASDRWLGIKILDMETGSLMDHNGFLPGAVPVTLDGPSKFLSVVKSLVGEPLPALHTHIH